MANIQNLFSRSDSSNLADYPTNSNVTAAAFTWPTGNPGLLNAVTFGDNSVSRTAAKAYTLVGGTTYTLSFYVLMDDLGAPILGVAGIGVDFFVLVTIAINNTSAVVSRLDSTNIYRISYTFTQATTITTNVGLQKLSTPNSSPRTFKVSGFQLVTANWAGPYTPTPTDAAINNGSIRGLNTFRVPVAAPLNLTNLVAWYRADIGVSLATGVASWANLAPTGARPLTQGTTANQPLMVTGSNGLPSIRFDGVNDALKATFTLTQPETVFIVYKHITLHATQKYIFDGATVNGMTLQTNQGASSSMYSGVTLIANTQIASGSYAYATITFNGVSSQMRANGIVVASGNAGTNTADGLTLGAAGNMSSWTNIEVAEVIITNSVASAGEIATVESYLQTRYNL